MSISSKANFDSLVKRALEAAQAYYHSGNMLITDDEYDSIIEEIESIKRENPDWDDKGVISQVAAGTSSGAYITIKHKTPMLSLQKLKTIEEVASFEERAQSSLVFEVKLDGLAISASYLNGKLHQIATRGDGNIGEDITSKKDIIFGLPQVINYKKPLEVRGEVYMSDADFLETNTNRVVSGAEAFLNSRNATAGLIRTLELSYDAKLSFAAYDVLSEENHLLYSEAISFIEDLGFSSVREITPKSRADSEAKNILSEIEAARPKLGFPIDGVVIKVDSYARRKELGFVSNAPKFAAAYKYSADTKTTKLLDIGVALGRTGQMSLRAVLEPVFVAGTTITYATLHNTKFITDADIRIGDTVYVYRAGDVIPRVDKVDKSKRPVDSKVWVAPANCIQCGKPWNKDNVIWRCENPNCSFLNRLVYALGRDALDIEGASEAVADALIREGLVKSIPDIYTIKKEDLSNLRLDNDRQLGDKMAEKIYNKILESKQLENYKFLVSLGLRTLGRTLSKRIMKDHHTLSEVLKLDQDALSLIEGIGKEKASIIHNELTLNAAEIQEYIRLGLGMANASKREQDNAAKPLLDKLVVISGSVPGYTRTEAQELVEKLGGKTSGSVSSKTDILVSGEGAGSKYDKAVQLGVEIWTPEKLLSLV
jgi:DNA ligase (NAD+)